MKGGKNLTFRYLPTKYKGFCAGLGLRGKSRSWQGLWESTKKNWGSHVVFRDLESQQKMLTLAFL